MVPKYKNGFSLPSTVSPISNRLSVLGLKIADCVTLLSGHRILVSPNDLRQYIGRKYRKAHLHCTLPYWSDCHSNCISGWPGSECKWHIYCLHSDMSGPSPSAHSHTPPQHTPTWEGMDTYSALHVTMHTTATNSPYKEITAVSFFSIFTAN